MSSEFHKKGSEKAEQGRLGEALAYFDKAIETDPNSAVYMIDKARVLMRLGKFKDAEKCLKTVAAQAKVNNRIDTDAYYLLGLLYSTTGQIIKSNYYFMKIKGSNKKYTLPNDAKNSLHNLQYKLAILLTVTILMVFAVNVDQISALSAEPLRNKIWFLSGKTDKENNKETEELTTYQLPTSVIDGKYIFLEPGDANDLEFNPYSSTNGNWSYLTFNSENEINSCVRGDVYEKDEYRRTDVKYEVKSVAKSGSSITYTLETYAKNNKDLMLIYVRIPDKNNTDSIEIDWGSGEFYLYTKLGVNIPKLEGEYLSEDGSYTMDFKTVDFMNENIFLYSTSWDEIIEVEYVLSSIDVMDKADGTIIYGLELLDPQDLMATHLTIQFSNAEDNTIGVQGDGYFDEYFELSKKVSSDVQSGVANIESKEVGNSEPADDEMLPNITNGGMTYKDIKDRENWVVPLNKWAAEIESYYGEKIEYISNQNIHDYLLNTYGSGEETLNQIGNSSEANDSSKRDAGVSDSNTNKEKSMVTSTERFENYTVTTTEGIIEINKVELLPVGTVMGSNKEVLVISFNFTNTTANDNNYDSDYAPISAWTADAIQGEEFLYDRSLDPSSCFKYSSEIELSHIGVANNDTVSSAVFYEINNTSEPVTLTFHESMFKPDSKIIGTKVIEIK